MAGAAARLLAPFVPGILVAGVIGTLVASLLLWGREEAAAEASLADRHRVVVDYVDRALDQTVIRLAAVAGLYQASDEVEEIEFRRFVRNLGLSPGMDAIGYMSVVPHHRRAAYEAKMAELDPGFVIFELDRDGRPIPAGDRRRYAPLEVWEPEAAFPGSAGYDSLSHPDRAEALEMARATRAAAVTPFLSLITESEQDGFLVYWPVTDKLSGALTGYAVAPMDLGALMEAAVAPLGEEILAWEVRDQTGRPIVNEAATLAIGGRTWAITVTPNPDSELVADPTYPLLLLGLGLVITAIAASALRARQRHQNAQDEFDRLRELASAKDQFLASVGHELRTPLTSVLGFAELLRSEGAGLSDEERRNMISAVADEATDLAAIVDDLLVAARSELNLLVVQRVPVSVRAQVSQVLEMSQRPDRQDVEVVADPALSYRALGDPGRVRQILRNLVTNAGRYGGGAVVVRLHQDEDWVRVEVRDDGPGVPEAESEQIFDPYYRAHPGGSEPAALGIGLAVARQLARLMDGELRYRREDGWTVFELVLPRSVSPIEAAGEARRIGAPAV